MTHPTEPILTKPAILQKIRSGVYDESEKLIRYGFHADTEIAKAANERLRLVRAGRV
uniref:Uncharacterized protein n=1 Tax=viral metagenome TaxID=1070528 RepID=A0A6H1ZLK0_9ZZZZ